MDTKLAEEAEKFAKEWNLTPDVLDNLMFYSKACFQAGQQSGREETWKEAETLVLNTGEPSNNHMKIIRAIREAARTNKEV